MTRAEAQAHTRERLVDAAERLFLAQGYTTVRLSAIATAAGYSTGAVYSNFTGKADLAFAVLDRVRAREVARLRLALARARPGGADDLSEFVTVFGAWAQSALEDSPWFRLELEFALQARRDPTMVAELSARHRQFERALVTTLVARWPAIEQTAAAAHGGALLSMGIGLAVQRMVEPQVTARPLVRALAALLAPGIPPPPDVEPAAEPGVEPTGEPFRDR